MSAPGNLRRYLQKASIPKTSKGRSANPHCLSIWDQRSIAAQHALQDAFDRRKMRNLTIMIKGGMEMAITIIGMPNLKSL